MDSAFYVARNDAADSWQILSRTGSPCMARGTLAAALETAAKLAAVKANRLEWPLPVFRAADDDTPATWDGELTSGGEWRRIAETPAATWTKFRDTDGRYGIRGPDGRRLPGLVIGGGRRWAAEVGGETIGHYPSAAAACAALFKATTHT